MASRALKATDLTGLQAKTWAEGRIALIKAEIAEKGMNADLRAKLAHARSVLLGASKES